MKLWLVVFIGAFVVGACGSSDPAGDAAPIEDTSTADASAATPTPEETAADCTLFIVFIEADATQAEIDTIGAGLTGEGLEAWFVDQVTAFREFTGEVFGTEGQTNVMVEPEQLPTSYRVVVEPAAGAELVERWRDEAHVVDALVEPGDAAACAGG